MIVLTGGSGFIGSCLLKKLNDNGIDDVMVVDRLGESTKWKNLVRKKYIEYTPKDEFISMIIEEDEDFANDIELIIHLGACTSTTEKNVDYLIENNHEYTAALADFANDHNIRLIYASSAATYGNGEYGYNDTGFEELEPLNPYGFSKHITDLWMIENEFDHDVTGLKFFNVYGPNEYHKGDMSSMIFKAYNQINETGKMKLFKSYHPDYKDGEQMRDFIYVKDVVEIIWRIIENPKIHGIFNLGTGKARTWNDLAGSVFKAMGKEINIEYIDMPDALKNQYQYFTQAEMKRLNKAVGGFQFTSLEDGIEDYVQNYLMKTKKYL